MQHTVRIEFEFNPRRRCQTLPGPRQCGSGFGGLVGAEGQADRIAVHAGLADRHLR